MVLEFPEEAPVEQAYSLADWLSMDPEVSRNARVSLFHREGADHSPVPVTSTPF